jgi:Arc/MetJ family transcription regulator
MKRRTNIVLDEELVERIRRRYHLRTKTAVVDLALRNLAHIPMTREEALAMQGAYPDFDVPPDYPPPEH